jgi:DNA modification methylase
MAVAKRKKAPSPVRPRRAPAELSPKPRRAPAEASPKARRAPIRTVQAPLRVALDYTGGETLVAGDEALSAILAGALDTEKLPRDRLTHGFHSYPARMHWATVARVLEALAQPGEHVVDPFCGSGTVLVEARVRGLSATGIDLNPLAVRLSRLKSEPLDANKREALCTLANELRVRSEERVMARDPIRAKLPKSEIAWYETHVLKEMAGLKAEIDAVEDHQLREACTLVFSSLIVKFSRQRSDTAEEQVAKRLRKGLVSEFFERKAYELAERLGELEAMVKGPRPKVVEGDARAIDELVTRQADLVLSSPPYGGTYDYVSHHQRRFAWLGIDDQTMARSEIGARRRAGQGDRFERELFGVLRGAHRVLRKDGLVVLLMGDAVQDGEQVPADDLIADLAEQTGFLPLAVASQPRPEARGTGTRMEHLMALRRR